MCWFFIGWDNARHSAFPQRGRGRFQGSFLFFFVIIIIKASYFLVKRNELQKDRGEIKKIQIKSRNMLSKPPVAPSVVCVCVCTTTTTTAGASVVPSSGPGFPICQNLADVQP